MSVRLREPHSQVPTRPAVKVMGWYRSVLSSLRSADPAASRGSHLTRVVALARVRPDPTPWTRPL
ncbi:hypothetical protein [Saccharothrix yanglingensis]|uniref:Uncharacterized protein n=1 Tax=Saccharothrix yanglingensis TaxID=659496 RepID=A0ABU0X9R0_9PSEU|nr:hypothetical protein [Saccharothrix yanglingensis]MDQ2588877.1 hypothetical protein [Saccharothrix yanglingensis]